MTIEIQNFWPEQNYTVATTTASSVNQTFQNNNPNVAPQNGSPLSSIRLASAASSVAFARVGVGTQVATTTGINDIPILPNEDVVLGLPPGSNNVGIILAAGGTGNVYVGVGRGS